jgi:hypothetical protein
MSMIQFNYTYNVPNELCVDHTFTDGKTRTAQYDGPDKLFFIVNNTTGREELGPVTEIEKRDGRPVPDGCRYVEIDATEYPELCQLRGPILDEMEEDHTGSATPSGVTHVTGYAPFTYQTPILPYQFLHDELVTFAEDGTPTIPVKEPRDFIMGTDIGRDITWDDVRAKRNQFLKNSDSEVTDDMPSVLRNQWLDYRQRLRDWPAAMQAAGNSPIMAYNMETIQVGANPTTGMIEPDTDSITM